MNCCDGSNGCCSSSKPPLTPPRKTTSARAASTRSMDSSQAALSQSQSQLPILSMLPAGKPCCAENSNEVGGGCGSGGGMNETSNVLVQYTLQDLDRRSEYNFWLGLLCLGVCAVNCVLFYLNYAMYNGKEPKPNVSHRHFHLLEFWTSCIYSIAETFALVMSPKTMMHIYNKPTLLKLLLFFNVVNSTIPALFMTLDFEYFEKTSHELEFINSFTLSFITMILLASLLNPPSLDEDIVVPPPSLNREQDNNGDKASIVMGLIACLVAASNFVVYNAGLHEAAHYLEFSFNIIVSLITFWFCMDNRFMSQMEIGQILYGKHANCIFCQIRTNDLQTQMQSSSKYQNMFGGEQVGGQTNEITIVNPIRGALAFSEARQERAIRNSVSGSFASLPINDDDEEMQKVVNERTPLIMNGSRLDPARKVVSKIDSEEDFQATLKQYPLVLVMMCASWCKPCQAIQPAYASLAKKHHAQSSMIVFCTADVDDLDDLTCAYDVANTPTFLLFRNGQHQKTKEGPNGWEHFVEEALKQ